MIAPCPDCSAVPVELHLEHDDTCPLGQALDVVVAGDREWFEAHPFATERHRPLTVVERSERLMVGDWTVAYMTHVRVIKLAPGMRLRRLYALSAA